MCRIVLSFDVCVVVLFGVVDGEGCMWCFCWMYGVKWFESWIVLVGLV